MTPVSSGRGVSVAPADVTANQPTTAAVVATAPAATACLLRRFERRVGGVPARGAAVTTRVDGSGAGSDAAGPACGIWGSLVMTRGSSSPRRPSVPPLLAATVVVASVDAVWSVLAVVAPLDAAVAVVPVVAVAASAVDAVPAADATDEAAVALWPAASSARPPMMTVVATTLPPATMRRACPAGCGRRDRPPRLEVRAMSDAPWVRLPVRSSVGALRAGWQPPERTLRTNIAEAAGDTTPVWQARPMMRPGDELRLFLDEAVPRFRAAGAEPGSFEERMAWQQILAEGGWVAPAWPIEHGGRGLATADRIECDEILASSGTPLIAGTLGVKNVGPTIARWGSDEQKAHLPRILAGVEVWCQGFSEPDAGSDLASLRTRAVIDGDDFVIDGEKVWTTQGLRATHCELLARTDPDAPKHAGISALLIPLELPGIERRPIRQITGDVEFASMSFHEVRVPHSCLLGPLHEGWTVTTSTLAHERAGVAMFATRHEAEVVALADTCTGDAGWALDPVARQLLMRRYIDARLIGLVGRKILATLVQGGTPGPEQQVIKLAWSLGEQRLGEARATLAGPALMAGGAPVAEHALLQSRASTIAAGTTEVMKNLIAERVLGLPRG